MGDAIQARFRSNNLENLNLMINEVLNELKEINGVKDLKIDDVIGENEIFVKIDYAAADRVGLDVQIVGDTIRAAIAGRVASKVTLNNREVELFVRFDEPYRKDLNDLNISARALLPALSLP